MKRNRREILPAALFVLALGPGAGFMAYAQGQEPPVVAAQVPAPPSVVEAPAGDWTAVRRETLHEETPAVGSFKAKQLSKLGTQVSGRVQDVLVDVGDTVKKGQELVRIDATFFQIELEQRKADLETVKARIESARQSIKTFQAEVSVAKASLDDAELQLQRMKSLWEKPDGSTPSIPKRMYDEAVFGKQQAAARVESAQSRLAEAQAKLLESSSSVKQAEQAVKWAEKRLAETIIRAPFNGVVTNRMVDPGEPVTSTPITHLVEIKDAEELELEFSLPQSMLSRVQKGTPVEFEVEGIDAGTGKGQIAVVFPDVDEATRSFRCKVLVDNAGLKYRPGLLVRVRIVNDRKDVLVVPRGALHQGPDGWQVRVAKDGQPVWKKVEAGLQTEDAVEIRGGLQEGEQVLVSRDDD